MMTRPFAILLTFALSLLRCFAQPAQITQSNGDLWDVSQGMTILRHSAVDNCGRDPATPYDIRDIFGGQFVDCPGERDAILFADNAPSGFVHFVEWRLAAPATVRSFNLWAGGDGALTIREMESFRLLTKSPGAKTFDVVLHTFTPSHPYTYVDGIFALLISTDIKPVTAQEFRAEFTNRTGSQFSPRIWELDGFSSFIGPRLGIRTSEVEIAWDSVAGLNYQIESRSDVTGSNWMALGSPVEGTGNKIRISEKVPVDAPRRFYRVRLLD